jgi:hypothetical protein
MPRGDHHERRSRRPDAFRYPLRTHEIPGADPLGVEWGQGILSLSNGTQYRFRVKGLEAGGVGAAQAFLHGHVYHVTKVADFAGL